MGYFHPRIIAEGIVYAVDRGDIQTVGQWWALRERYRELPPRLQVWVYQELVLLMGQERVAYALGPEPGLPSVSMGIKA